LFFFASAVQAAIIFSTSSAVRVGLLRMVASGCCWFAFENAHEMRRVGDDREHRTTDRTRSVPAPPEYCKWPRSLGGDYPRDSGPGSGGRRTRQITMIHVAAD
jgi:hypothetical protein